MKIAMNDDVLDKFVNICRSDYDINSADEDENALLEIRKYSARYCLLPGNIEHLNNLQQNNNTGAIYIIETNYLGKCFEGELNISDRMDELKQNYEEDELDCRLLAEAEASGVDFLLTKREGFIKELGPRANNLKILRPNDCLKEIQKTRQKHARCCSS